MAPNVSTDPVAAAQPPPGRVCLWVLGLALVLVILFHESLLGGKGLVPADGTMSFLPWTDLKGPANILLSDQFLVFLPQHQFQHQQFLAGHFPLWNPYLACGLPNLASSQGALLFPINLLLLPLSPFYAGGLAAFIKLFLAGWFTMLYLRQLGASNSGAFLSGLVFSLSGFMIVWLGHPHVNSAIWLPLLLYLVERFFSCLRQRVSSTRVCAGFALAFGCMLLGGHPPTMIYVALFVGIYLVFRWLGHLPAKPWRPAAGLLGAMLVGVLLAAPAILPFLEYDACSSEAAASAGLHRTGLALSLNSLIFYLLPQASGSPVAGWENTFLRLGVGRLMDNYNERTGYVGVLPWLFALYAVGGRRNRFVWFYALMVPVLFLFIFGAPPLMALLNLVPVLRSINPTRLILLVGFAVAVLAGLGWDRFQKEAPGQRKWGLLAGFWVVVGAVLLGYALMVAPRWHLLAADCRFFLRSQLFLLLGSGIVSGALFLPALAQRRGLLTGLALGWVVADLLAFAWNYNPQITRDRYYPATPAITWLQQHAGSHRILGDQMLLAPDVPQVFGLRDARGDDFMSVRRYEELINGQTGDFFFYRSASRPPACLPLLGVQYWLSFRKPNPDPSRYELVYSNEVAIYQYRPVCDRALVVYDYQVSPDSAILPQVRSEAFDPRRMVLLETPPDAKMAALLRPTGPTNATVRILADEADSVAVAAQLSQPGFLLLLDTWFPGWTATVNGQAAKLYRADYNFRAVQLPAGSSTVRFAFRPASFRVGLLLAGVGWLILGIACWASRRKSGVNPLSSATKRQT